MHRERETELLSSFSLGRETNGRTVRGREGGGYLRLEERLQWSAACQAEGERGD